MLAVFDVDGTICDTQEVEGRCYMQAVELVTGVRLQSLDWEQFKEPTSSGILYELLHGDAQCDQKIGQVKEVFVELMEKEQPKYPGDFTPLPMAVEFIQHLLESEFCSVAIATGGFDSEAEFKLKCCGISLHDFPHATSSDTPKRRDILSLAVKKAGGVLEKVVYFGDAPWDVKVSQELGIPMIGIGRRTEQLRELGVSEVFRDYSNPSMLLSALQKLSCGL